MTPTETLEQYFGLPNFRAPQEAIIQEVLNSRDALVVMPTGGGKSLCFQLPALLLPGTTLVVSPLIALMKDQVDALRARGLPAGLLNSSQSLAEQRATLDNMSRGELKLVYVAPERFRSQGFMEAVPREAISLLAIDEAHCLSQWGHDFRPDYMRLGVARENLGSPPCIALTATATPDVQNDIIHNLGMRNPARFVAGFARDNLSFRVTGTPSEKEKMEVLERLLREHGTGIIYCATRKSVEAVAAKIQPLTTEVIHYHGGLRDEERTTAQERFMRGEANVVVATNAFGMGIDRADIRFVCHYEMPGSVEAYYQEGGRAGRDGLPAVCEMLFSYADKRVQDFFIEGSNPGKALIAEVFDLLCAESDANHEVRLPVDELCEKMGRSVNPMAVSTSISVLTRHGWIERFDIPGRRVRGTRIRQLGQRGSELPIDGQALAEKAARDEERLKSVIRFAYARSCRQNWILDYFGETESRACGRCDACANTATVTARPLGEDEYSAVRKALSGVARMSRRHGPDKWTPRFGKRKIMQSLLGSNAAPLREAGIDQLSTHGILKDKGRSFIENLFEAMEAAGLVETVTEQDFPLLGLTERGARVMRGVETVTLSLAEPSGDPHGKRDNEKQTAENKALYTRLVRKRRELAAAAGKPAFTVFPNAVLVELANRRPQTTAEATAIKGIGPDKANSVLAPFLEIIRTSE
ncbi:MAG: RecQ family ATP-dependent DNA helicase [Opitutales bacterium]